GRLTPQHIRVRLKQRSQQAGLAAPVHPHMLRHSFASHVLQSSGDLRAVQELLGHTNITTTQAYTRLDFQHLAKIYDKTHPRALADSAAAKASAPGEDAGAGAASAKTVPAAQAAIPASGEPRQ
ncbi:MAG: tyrosine-type recombinase/integrase, partial [Polaromonas sp.]|nr:tyrosine-type recombinase/integrase [Polaromonas sp.]